MITRNFQARVSDLNYALSEQDRTPLPLCVPQICQMIPKPMQPLKNVIKKTSNYYQNNIEATSYYFSKFIDLRENAKQFH